MHTKRAAGFTLVELMIVVAVIAILAAIAYPNYTNYIVNSRRGGATTCLLEAAQFMERSYTTEMAYDKTRSGAAIVLPNLPCRSEMQAHYDIALSASSARAYTVSATPKGTQAAKDTKCATLSIDQTGTRRSSNTSTDVNTCF